MNVELYVLGAFFVWAFTPLPILWGLKTLGAPVQVESGWQYLAVLVLCFFAHPPISLTFKRR